MGIFNFSSNKAEQDNVQRQQETQQNQPQKQPSLATHSEQVKKDSVNPADPTAVGVASSSDNGQQKNPLDAFKDLYTIDSASQGADTPQHLNLTDEVFTSVLPKLDFTSSLPPELKQRVLSGDTAAMLEAMNIVGGNAYKTGMQHNSSLMNDHLDQRFSAFKPDIDKSVRANLDSNSISSLPNAANPVIKAELDRVSKALRAKYPTADASWVADQSHTYLRTLGEQLAGNSSSNPNRPSSLPDTVDFADLLSS